EILSEKNVLITEQKEEIEQTLEELRTTQGQLIESEKMASLGNLVTGVAHEINTPVGIGITASSALVDDTKLFVDLYKSGKMTRKELEQYIDNMYQAGNLILKNMNRTGELVQRFKQVSVDQQTDQQREFQLLPYLDDIILAMKPELEKKKIAVQIECPEDCRISSYPAAFATIITNLISNSLKHGFREKETGRIKIVVVETNGRLSLLQNNLILQYSDNGCGIPEEHLPKIFDPFFTTDKQAGAGLGLNIVYNLVTQKLKGSCRCMNTKDGGVMFQITIPVSSK
ncbi:MAG: HAMP domain-containing histidine kinase, partial [Bacteroidetes bacterium]|nr:HAMP domain-containing histidine kinase [Bacteroidota bacterium]